MIAQVFLGGRRRGVGDLEEGGRRLRSNVPGLGEGKARVFRSQESSGISGRQEGFRVPDTQDLSCDLWSQEQ